MYQTNHIMKVHLLIKELTTVYQISAGYNIMALNQGSIDLFLKRKLKVKANTEGNLGSPQPLLCCHSLFRIPLSWYHTPTQMLKIWNWQNKIWNCKKRSESEKKFATEKISQISKYIWKRKKIFLYLFLKYPELNQNYI